MPAHSIGSRLATGCRLLLFGLLAAFPAVGAARQAAPPAAKPARIALSVLSSRPDMVTGGEALIRVEVPGRADVRMLHVTLDATDVTSAFQPAGDGRGMVGLVKGLIPGVHTLTASDANGSRAALGMTAYPVSGPVFSGPHETPFLCESDKFKLQAGGSLGPALDADCSVRTRVDYVYRSAAGGPFKPLPDPKRPPADVAQTTTSAGTAVPYIVRIETGTINRGVYQIALLHDPSQPPPDFRTRSQGWNGRLIYTFGGGCPGGWFRQGRDTGGVDDDVMLGHGYAVASSSLNVFGNNCNDLLAAETMMMVKERFVEAYGAPLFTIGWGCSGGSYQAHQIADNYPGLLDGIVVGCSFPDVGHASISVHSFGHRLMYHYFQSAGVPWTEAEQVAASGAPDYISLKTQGTRPDRIRPRDVCDPGLDVKLLYDAAKNPHGARCTVYDHTVNVYGRDATTGFARRFLDNVGVQYGLTALNQGKISKAQFLDLNEKVGGIDLDADFIPQRTVGDPQAIRVAYESGRILNGGGGLASTPIIDYRGYADFTKGDPHQRFYSFSTRQRLIRANGNADNQVMLIEDGAKYGLFSTKSPLLQDALRQMDRWLTALASDTSPGSRAAKVVKAKPADLLDACIDKDGRRIVEKQQYGTGVCNALYPSHASPYLVAGMPVTNDVLKCQLKPIALSDYDVTFTDPELKRLRAIFPGGVCDYGRPGIEQRPLKGTWLSFGPSTTNRVLSTQP